MKNILLIGLILTLPLLAGADTIDTLSLWSGTNYLGALGDPGTATIGQTFRLDPGHDTVLQSLTFVLDDCAPPLWNNIDDITVSFGVYLYEWDGFNIVGDALFESGEYSTTAQPTDETFVVDMGGIELAYETDYVWFLSTSLYIDGLRDGAHVAQQPYTYNNGHVVYMDNRSNFALLATGTWRQWYDNDLAFIAEFSPSEVPAPVPEPTTLVLIGLGLMSVVARRLILR